MTAQERRTKRAIFEYENSYYNDIHDAYVKPSTAKLMAWEHCKRLERDYKGWGLAVVSKNTSVFTAGFLFEDKNTGVVKFMYITPSYNTVIDY